MYVKEQVYVLALVSRYVVYIVTDSKHKLRVYTLRVEHVI